MAEGTVVAVFGEGVGVLIRDADRLAFPFQLDELVVPNDPWGEEAYRISKELGPGHRVEFEVGEYPGDLSDLERGPWARRIRVTGEVVNPPVPFLARFKRGRQAWLAWVLRALLENPIEIGERGVALTRWESSGKGMDKRLAARGAGQRRVATVEFGPRGKETPGNLRLWLSLRELEEETGERLGGLPMVELRARVFELVLGWLERAMLGELEVARGRLPRRDRDPRQEELEDAEVRARIAAIRKQFKHRMADRAESIRVQLENRVPRLERWARELGISEFSSGPARKAAEQLLTRLAKYLQDAERPACRGGIELDPAELCRLLDELEAALEQVAGADYWSWQKARAEAEKSR